MNFHYELRKSSCRKELKRRTGRSLDILEVRRHELTAACSPSGRRAGFGTIRAWAASTSPARRDSTSAGWIRWRMHSMNWPTPIQAKYCPETGF